MDQDSVRDDLRELAIWRRIITPQPCIRWIHLDPNHDLCTSMPYPFVLEDLVIHLQAGADRPTRVRRPRPVDGSRLSTGRSEGARHLASNHHATTLYSVDPSGSEP